MERKHIGHIFVRFIVTAIATIGIIFFIGMTPLQSTIAYARQLQRDSLQVGSCAHVDVEPINDDFGHFTLFINSDTTIIGSGTYTRNDVPMGTWSAPNYQFSLDSNPPDVYHPYNYQFTGTIHGSQQCASGAIEIT